MKKISIILVVSILFGSLFSVPVVSAQTLGDLKKQLDKQEADLDKNKQEQQLTQQEIDATNASIKKTQIEIENIFTDIKNTEESIVKLNENIEAKKKQMKEIVNFVQVSNGESAYLEYAFGAKDFTDFVYRMAVSEQLTKYNEKLIEEYTAMIKENEQKKVDLGNKNIELSAKQAELSKKIESLESVKTEQKEGQLDIENQIKYQRDLIQLYKDKGCSDDQDIKSCGSSLLPPDTAFFRPVTSGTISSNFGYRGVLAGIDDKNPLHNGLDFAAGASTKIPVYSIAKGMVSGIVDPTLITPLIRKCGGKEVFIQHFINGKTYTSLYAHLLSYNVSVGDFVTKDSIIGIQGGGPETQSWESCAKGYHVHLTIATGLYGTDYRKWSEFEARMFDPRLVVNAPPLYGKFTNRDEKF